MARKRRPNAPQTHPTGPLETVDDGWKADVRAVMKARGWTQQDLAGKIGASNGSMTNIFKPGDRQTRYRRLIEEVCEFKIDTAKLAEVLERVERKWSTLSIEKAKLVEALVDQLATKPPANEP